MKKHFISITEYNLWANKRITNLAHTAGDEIINQTMAGSFSSVKKTILHIWDAETIWLNRLKGISIDYFPSQRFENDKDSSLHFFTDNSMEFKDFIGRQKDRFFDSICRYSTTKGEEFMQRNEQIITHCMNHSTFHRGQVISQLRTAGFSQLQSTDYIVYLREQNQPSSELDDVYGSN